MHYALCIQKFARRTLEFFEFFFAFRIPKNQTNNLSGGEKVNRNLNSKLVQIFIIFIISVMIVVGVILLNSVFDFYRNDFVQKMDDGFSRDTIMRELSTNLESSDHAKQNKELLLTYSGVFGFDSDRCFYILDMNGNILATNSGDAEKNPEKTLNMLAAMNGETGKKQSLGANIMDYAFYIASGGNECIIYITDSLSQMKSLTWMLFSIIIQALLVGLVIAVILSFFLAQAITSPLEKITAGTLKISEGASSHRLENSSKDEIGVLTRNFNSMAQVIENTLDAVNGEKEKLSKIIGCLGDAVAAFDADGELMFTNKSARKILNIRKDDNINFESFTEKLDIPITPQFLKLSKNINIKEHRIRVFRDKDTIIDIEFATFNYDKSETGFLAVVQDVTEKALLEKSRREFIANVSHELRTPLTSIKGATETVMMDDEMPESMRNRFLGIVMNEADRMTRIVKDLLVLSRFDNRKMTWQMSSFSAGLMINQICTALETAAEHKHHTLECKADEERLGTLKADKERIEQVLTNIIGNAIKYTPEGGKIVVKAENFMGKKKEHLQPEKYIRISVRDNGIGIPKEDLPRLFERFYRVDKARTSDMGGTGLGLSIAKEIVEAHNGYIFVESNEGKGTVVTIELPLDTGIESA